MRWEGGEKGDKQIVQKWPATCHIIRLVCQVYVTGYTHIRLILCLLFQLVTNENIPSRNMCHTSCHNTSCSLLLVSTLMFTHTQV